MKIFTGMTKAAGLPPGSVVYTGAPRNEPARIETARYDGESCEHLSSTTMAEAVALCGAGGVKWLNIIGVHDVELVQQIGARLGIHPLVQEDIVNTHHRHHLHSCDLYRRYLRHELRAYAGTAYALGISGGIGRHGRHRGRHAHLLPPQRVVLGSWALGRAQSVAGRDRYGAHPVTPAQKHLGLQTGMPANATGAFHFRLPEQDAPATSQAKN